MQYIASLLCACVSDVVVVYCIALTRKKSTEDAISKEVHKLQVEIAFIEEKIQRLVFNSNDAIEKNQQLISWSAEVISKQDEMNLVLNRVIRGLENKS